MTNYAIEGPWAILERGAGYWVGEEKFIPGPWAPGGGLGRTLADCQIAVDQVRLPSHASAQSAIACI